jgi:hypothetical protein
MTIARRSESIALCEAASEGLREMRARALARPRHRVGEAPAEE